MLSLFAMVNFQIKTLLEHKYVIAELSDSQPRRLGPDSYCFLMFLTDRRLHLEIELISAREVESRYFKKKDGDPKKFDKQILKSYCI